MAKTSIGARVGQMARDLTGEQIAELVAVKRNQLLGIQSPIMSSHGQGPMLRPLIRRKLVDWLPPPEPFGRGWRLPVITNLGERVLLRRCEIEMDAILPKYEPEPE